MGENGGKMTREAESKAGELKEGVDGRKEGNTEGLGRCKELRGRGNLWDTYTLHKSPFPR